MCLLVGGGGTCSHGPLVFSTECTLCVYTCTVNQPCESIHVCVYIGGCLVVSVSRRLCISIQPTLQQRWLYISLAADFYKCIH